MGYLMDNSFPFGLEIYLFNKKEIAKKGLQIIAQIQSETIYDNSNELKKFLVQLIPNVKTSVYGFCLVAMILKGGCLYS